MVKRFQEKGRNFHNDKIGLQEDITILNLRASNSIVSKYTGKKKTDKAIQHLEDTCDDTK